MSLSYLQRERVLVHHVSTEAQNGETKTLALEGLLRCYGTCTFSYMLGKGEVFSWLQSAASPLDATKSYILHL